MGTAARTLPRAALALGLGLAVGVGGAAAATAVESPSPSESTTGYPQEEEPTLEVDILQPICDGDVPYLLYKVTATGTDNTLVTITWLNPSGADVVQADLPLEGRVLWPGAEVAADGSPLDWPGWRLVDGVWVEGDEFDWVRPSVDVKFEVNPELTTTAAYPPSSPDCATNPPGETPPGETPPGETPSDETTPGDAAPVPGSTEPGAVPAAAPPGGGSGFLPQTGAEVGTLAAVAAGLVVVGAGITLLVRRRRTTD